jgi:hypothetical protein
LIHGCIEQSIGLPSMRGKNVGPTFPLVSISGVFHIDCATSHEQQRMPSYIPKQ